MNEMQVITTSEKVRTSLAAKRARGEYVANFAPYGYTKDPANRHRLVVDETAACIVRRIFALRLQGTSASNIARQLNAQAVPAPATHRKLAGSDYSTQFGHTYTGKWHAASVLRILRDETYTGTLVQGKTERANWRSHTSTPVPKESWQRFPQAHEPIVDSNVFRQVSQMLGG